MLSTKLSGLLRPALRQRVGVRAFASPALQQERLNDRTKGALYELHQFEKKTGLALGWNSSSKEEMNMYSETKFKKKGQGFAPTGVWDKTVSQNPNFDPRTHNKRAHTTPPDDPATLSIAAFMAGAMPSMWYYYHYIWNDTWSPGNAPDKGDWAKQWVLSDPNRMAKIND